MFLTWYMYVCHAWIPFLLLLLSSICNCDYTGRQPPAELVGKYTVFSRLFKLIIIRVFFTSKPNLYEAYRWRR